MIFKALSSLVSGIVSPVAGIFERREERKTVQERIKGKVALVKQQGASSVQLSDAEWEEISASNLGNSWKDEWVTVVFTSPVVAVLLGAIVAAFTGNTNLIDGTLAGIRALKTLGIDFDLIVSAVVFAAIGLKAWRATK